MRTSRVDHKLFDSRAVLRVVEPDRLAGEWRPDLRLAVRVNTAEGLVRLTQLATAGVHNIAVLTSDPALFDHSTLPGLMDLDGALEEGDVIGLTPGLTRLRVLVRESDVHHTVFVTNQCNSSCLMCSQPPTKHDDSWLIDEAVAVASHMRVSPATLGFTGGEPLLLGYALRTVLDAFHRWHPETRAEVLTNARLFADMILATGLLDGLGGHVTWMVPLYGHADFLHDYVVQSRGAFDETLDGLLTLRAFRQRIQLRTVLIEPVLRILPDLCDFIARNLPFVREVALMGCEPIGFALANRGQCHVDLFEWWSPLLESVGRLHRAGVPVVLMNTPLCTLPRELWQYTQQSISDWKRVFADECSSCAVRARCCGLFASHRGGWQPTRTLRPIAEEPIL